MKSGLTSMFVLLAIANCLAISACHSSPDPETAPAPVYTGEHKSTPAEELTLIRADSEVFAAVVRAQLNGNSDEYPYRLGKLRYDSRPYGTRSGYPEQFAGVQGIDPTLTFGRADKEAIDELRDRRKAILKAAGVPEGVSKTYAQCAGVRAPQPPPARGSKTRRPDVRAGCPKTPEYYLTVGLPVRGQPPGLRNARDLKGNRVSMRGDVWTVLVEELSIGPKGWSRAQYGWLLRRNGSGDLELETAVLIGVVE